MIVGPWTGFLPTTHSSSLLASDWVDNSLAALSRMLKVFTWRDDVARRCESEKCWNKYNTWKFQRAILHIVILLRALEQFLWRQMCDNEFVSFLGTQNTKRLFSETTTYDLKIRSSSEKCWKINNIFKTITYRAHCQLDEQYAIPSELVWNRPLNGKYVIRSNIRVFRTLDIRFSIRAKSAQ